jgi:hypothetical protein
VEHLLQLPCQRSRASVGHAGDGVVHGEAASYRQHEEVDDVRKVGGDLGQPPALGAACGDRRRRPRHQ